MEATHTQSPAIQSIGKLMAGLFFAFSAFIMQALSRLPAEQSMAAMQRINAAVPAIDTSCPSGRRTTMNMSKAVTSSVNAGSPLPGECSTAI